MKLPTDIDTLPHPHFVVSPSEILMNLNKICNKLIWGYYDKWCPVVAENGSSPSITSGEYTGWAENFSMWKIAYKHVEEST